MRLDRNDPPNPTVFCPLEEFTDCERVNRELMVSSILLTIDFEDAPSSVCALTLALKIPATADLLHTSLDIFGGG
jgi:hypothetical protein